MRIFALSCLLASRLYALTLSEAVEFTLKNSPEIEINLHKRDIAKAELSKAYSQFFPTVTVSGEFSDQNFNQANLATTNDDLEFNYWHKEVTCEATQNVFDGLSRYNQLQQNKHELRAQQFVYHNNVYDKTLELAKLMYELEYSQNVISMAKDNFNKINEIKELIAKRVQEGLSKDIELTQAKGRLAVAKSNILESLREFRNLKAKFTQVTGGLKAEDIVSPALLSKQYGSYNDFWREVQENGTSIKPYHALQKGALHNYKAQQGRNLPSVDLYAKYKYDKGIGDNPSALQRVSNIGLKTSWAIFEGGRQNLETYIHAQKYQQSRQELKKQTHNLALQVEQAWENTSILKDSLPFLKEHTQSSLKTTKSYFDQFLLGQKTLLDLLDSHNELLRARKNELYNEMLLKHNQLQLSHLSGHITEELSIGNIETYILSEKELSKLENSFGIFNR